MVSLVNPQKLNFQEVQGVLSSRPQALPIFQEFLMLSNHTPKLDSMLVGRVIWYGNPEIAGTLCWTVFFGHFFVIPEDMVLYQGKTISFFSHTNQRDQIEVWRGEKSGPFYVFRISAKIVSACTGNLTKMAAAARRRFECHANKPTPA